MEISLSANSGIFTSCRKLIHVHCPFLKTKNLNSNCSEFPGRCNRIEIQRGPAGHSKCRSTAVVCTLHGYTHRTPLACQCTCHRTGPGYKPPMLYGHDAHHTHGVRGGGGGYPSPISPERTPGTQTALSPCMHNCACACMHVCVRVCVCVCVRMNMCAFMENITQDDWLFF